MIEPTDEMVKEFRHVALADEGGIAGGLAAVLAIVERDRYADVAAIRRTFDESLAAAIPVAGGRVLPLLKRVRNELARFDEEQARRA